MSAKRALPVWEIDLRLRRRQRTRPNPHRRRPGLLLQRPGSRLLAKFQAFLQSPQRPLLENVLQYPIIIILEASKTKSSALMANTPPWPGETMKLKAYIQQPPLLIAWSWKANAKNRWTITPREDAIVQFPKSQRTRPWPRKSKGTCEQEPWTNTITTSLASKAVN